MVLAEAAQRVAHRLEGGPRNYDQIGPRALDESPGRAQLVSFLNRVAGELEDGASRLSERPFAMD
jgi:hypothetical protein